MAIEPITAEEFRVVEFRGGGRSPTPEGKAVVALRPGDGFKAPCRWKHYGIRQLQCVGSSSAHKVASRGGFKVSTRCKDGVLYVFRPAEA
jgi:hypothetical protein